MNDIFTTVIQFGEVKDDVEFLRRDGTIWRKIGIGEADKVNTPSAGTIISMNKKEVVRIDSLDI